MVLRLQLVRSIGSFEGEVIDRFLIGLSGRGETIQHLPTHECMAGLLRPLAVYGSRAQIEVVQPRLDASDRVGVREGNTARPQPGSMRWRNRSVANPFLHSQTLPHPNSIRGR